MSSNLTLEMREKSSRTFVIVLAVLLVIVPTTFSSVTPARAATATEGIIIPLYTYPGSSWDAVASTKQVHPSVPIVAVVNPSNGPGYSYDQNYAAGIAKLNAAGVKVIGYVFTAYTSRALSAVEADINSWKTWYPGVSGVFFDEQSNTAGGENYYSQASAYANSKGLTFTVGNPGANTLPTYLNTVSLVLIYESPGLPSLSSYSGWAGYDKSKLGMIPFGVSPFSSSWTKSAEKVVGWIYVTNDVLPNPWDSVSPYLGNLASMFDSNASAPSGASSNPKLTIQAIDQSGNALNGMWITISQNGAVVSTGYTPLTVSLASGTYTVSAANYGQKIFSHWQDGTTSASKTISLGSDTVLTAYYNNGQITKTAITVSTSDSSGTPINGFYVVLYDSGGKLLQSQYSPATFTVDSGQTYQVQVADNGQYSFAHWQNGLTSRSITVSTSSAPTALTAYYKTSHANLTIKSVGVDGSAVMGIWITLTDSTGQVRTGYTPSSFTTTIGSSYSVTVADYANYRFAHWDNGSTVRTRTVIPTSDTSMIAYYYTQ